MARPQLRVAAGAGAIAAFLMAGGATIPVVAADPGHSRDGGGSHRGGDSQRGGSDSRRGGGDGRHGLDRGDRQGKRRGGITGPHRRSAMGGTHRNGRDPSRTDDDGTAGSDFFVIQPSASARTASPGLAAPGGTALPEASVPRVANTAGSDSGGAAVTGRPSFTAPSVTFGNGRTPGTPTGEPAAQLPRAGGGPAEVAVPTVAPLVEAPPPPPPPPPAPPSPPRAPLPGRLDMAPPWQRAAASLWAAAATPPSERGGLAFGIAGLILAPLAGMCLGYRQARANRAAAQLIEH